MSRVTAGAPDWYRADAPDWYRADAPDWYRADAPDWYRAGGVRQLGYSATRRPEHDRRPLSDPLAGVRTKNAQRRRQA